MLSRRAINLCKHYRDVSREFTLQNGLWSRALFTAERLGLDRFDKNKLFVQDKLGDQLEMFKSRMQEQLSELKTGGMIFSDDLKLMLHVSETEEDLATLEKMIHKFNEQDKQLHFSTFRFGPVVMRLLHSMNASETAYNWYIQEDLKDFFSDITSGLLLLDSLLENGHFDLCLKTYDVITERHKDYVTADCTTIAIAACFKQGTSDSLDRATEIIRQCEERNNTIGSRAVNMTASLALKQDKHHLADALLKKLDVNRNTVSGNLYMRLLLLLGRVDDALQMFERITTTELPEFVKAPVVYQDVVDQWEEMELNEVEQSKLKCLLDNARANSRLGDCSTDETLLLPMGAGQRRRAPHDSRQNGFKHRNRAPPVWQQRQRNSYASLAEI